jgi:hypothetical protein
VSRELPTQVAPPAAPHAAAHEPLWFQRPPASWLVGFAKFWYGFIIGDDWTMAAAVAVGLAVTALLESHGIGIWWLVPAIVIVVVGLDLERASRRVRVRPAAPSEQEPKT